VAGLFNRLEIWDEEKWNSYKINLEKNSDKIAEKLGELGIM
jgi:MraZ protein